MPPSIFCRPRWTWNGAATVRWFCVRPCRLPRIRDVWANIWNAGRAPSRTRFIWRNATSLLPLRSAAEEAIVLGRDTKQGMLSLLQRSVARDDLIAVCLAEWEKARSLFPAVGEARAAIARQGYRDTRSTGTGANGANARSVSSWASTGSPWSTRPRSKPCSRSQAHKRSN